ncbi:hypothetical protein M0D21_12955 [Aquimarina sp. D1M17]|uniref:matrixin family metalloprotease n=1 Tax=Aquimarina acroporae TaxID=2937283 RepID=UPI0020BF60C3|nr:matrixin family metalloprotease [Aquimarina acroporae]MCK8522486.1 hypothetical protein [Aquimarina acroporae]
MITTTRTAVCANANGAELIKKTSNKFKLAFIFTAIFFLFSCSAEEAENEPTEEIFVENPGRKVKVNIFYVENDGGSNEMSGKINEQEFIRFLNGYYFHRIDIGLELGKTVNLVNEELYDLRDNQGSEPSTFLMQTKESYDKNCLNIYIIKRSNIIGIAGMGRNQRVLLTDEFLYSSTSPHEIGHALGLFHIEEAGNIMSIRDKHSRKNFNIEQEEKMKKKIDRISTISIAAN